MAQPDPPIGIRPVSARLPRRPGAWSGFFAAAGLLLAVGAPTAAFAQGAPTGSQGATEVRGRVLDAADGTPIAGAVVAGGGASTVSGPDGGFLLRAAPSVGVVSVAAAGYFDLQVAVAEKGELVVRLVSRTLAEEVTVTAAVPEVDRPAATRVAPTAVLETAGTVDNIFRALTTLPGVTPTSDFGSYLSVRGGTPDQNLTLMDGIEVHNPYRLFGLVSAFNPETVSDFSLAAGGFGAKYGDRLSSLLIVENRPGAREFAATSALSVTDGNLLAEGPLPGGGSFLATARRTYYDFIAGRILDQNFPSFQDIQARLEWMFGPGHRLTFTGVRSREDTDFEFSDDDEDASVDFDADTRNDVAAVRLDAVLSDRLTTSTIVAAYRNTEDLDFEGEFPDEARTSSGDEDVLSAFGFERQIVVRDLSLRQELGFQAAPAHFLETGFELHGLDSGIEQSVSGIRNEGAANPSSIEGGAAIPDFLDSDLRGLRGGAWIQDTWSPGEAFSIEPGLRLEWSTVNGRSTISPRLAATWNVGSGYRLRTAGGLYTQSPGWEKLQASDYFLDLSGVRDLEHERAVHAVFGIEKDLPGSAQLRVEGYWKRFDGLLVGRLEDDSERLARVLAYDFPEELLASVPTGPMITIQPGNIGDGVARGVDVYLARLDPGARLAGWVSYAFGRAERETYGQRYPFEYDRRHALNVVGQLRLRDNLRLAGTWRLASGFPYTPAVGVRVAAERDFRGRYVPERDGDGNLVYIPDFGGLENLHSARLPAYARLDLRLTWQPRGPGGRWQLYAEVINALDRNNGLEIETEVVRAPDGGVPGIEETPSFGFPRLPTVGIRFRF